MAIRVTEDVLVAAVTVTSNVRVTEDVLVACVGFDSKTRVTEFVRVACVDITGGLSSQAEPNICVIC